MTGAAPQPGGVASERKRPLLRRIPTSLIVTLLGIALTAWLLPAITRQWDDRQKAHELKATLAADLASATARSLVEARAAARALVPGTAPQGLAATRRLNDMWLLDRLKI